MAIKNGLIPSTLLVQLRDQPAGARLLADAAASWERMCDECEARFGWRPRVTSGGDAFRPYDVQVRIFKQRYTTAGPTSVDKRGKWWAGQRWYRLPIYAAAATPGTSNHGLGCACDITGLGGFKGTRYRQLASIAARHGWDNNEGRSIAEAWHWVYKPHLDLVARTGFTVPNLTIPSPGGALPGLLTPEDDMLTSDQEAALTRMAAQSAAMWEWLQEMHVPVTVDLPQAKARLDELNVPDTRLRIGNLQHGLGLALDALSRLDGIDIDEHELAQALAPLVTANLGTLPDHQVQDIAKAAADEQDRRARERLNPTNGA